MENDFKTNEKISFYRKKQNVRKKLAQKGILHKEGVNSYDGYTYFTESQYKELFTELFSEVGAYIIIVLHFYIFVAHVVKPIDVQLLNLVF